MNVTFLQADKADDICHCSSHEVKFRSFQERTAVQLLARRHWERSRREVLMDVGEAMEFVREWERLIPQEPFQWDRRASPVAQELSGSRERNLKKVRLGSLGTLK